MKRCHGKNENVWDGHLARHIAGCHGHVCKSYIKRLYRQNRHITGGIDNDNIGKQ